MPQGPDGPFAGCTKGFPAPIALRVTASFLVPEGTPLTDKSHDRLGESENLTNAYPDYQGSFANECRLVFEEFVSALESDSSPQLILENVRDSIFIATLQGQILYSNRAYQEVFGGAINIIGRFGDSFLTNTVAPVSSASDQLIASGCRFVEFEHPGIDAQGRDVLFRSLKLSLLPLKRPNLGVFGVTRIIEVRNSELTASAPTLIEQWCAFQTLSTEERDVALQTIRGTRVKEIADRLGVSSKTIDNRRSSVLSKLSVQNSFELTKLMVRLHDNGFTDFGL